MDLPIVVVDGRVVGTWTADGDALAVALFAEAGPVNPDALAAEAAVAGQVLGRELTLTTVTT